MNAEGVAAPLAAGDPYAALSTELRAVVATDGRLHATSPNWALLLGPQPEPFEGRSLAELVHVDDRPVLEALLAALVRGAPPTAEELRLRHPEAGHLWFRCHAAPHPGDALGYLLLREVTEQRRDRAARELLEEESGVGTWELDLGSGRTVWSPVTHALHGTDPAGEALAVPASLARFPLPGRDRLAAAFEALRASGRPYDLELPFLAPDGSERFVRTVGRAVVRGEVVVRVYGTLGDVTAARQRQREREELAATKALLEEAHRMTGLGHFEGDLDHLEMWWSPMMFELVGVDPDRTPNAEERLALVHPEDREAVAALRSRLREERHVTIDLRVRHADGRWRRLRQVTRMVDDGSGRSGRFIGTVQDLTEVRAVEAALRDSEERLERVLAATDDGWWDIRLAEGTWFYSDRWWSLCGYTPADALPGVEPWRQLTHPDDLPAFEAAFTAMLAAGERTFVLPSAGRHRDGRRVPMVVRGIVDYDAVGNPVRISGATSDVTEARRAELTQERFIATVSHELRTPLTAIGGVLELFDRGVVGALPDPAVLLVEVARRNARRLEALIDDLLDLEGLLAASQPFELVTGPLAPVLDRAVLDNQPYADRHGVRLVRRSRPVTDRVAIDPGRIEQVLANLLSNAAKYAPEGTEVEVRLGPSPTAEDRVRIEVVDHGPGVPGELQERIFERFMQADPLDPRSRGGTGLGLAISREILTRHGGVIGLEPGPGPTCFWFELPVSGERD